MIRTEASVSLSIVWDPRQPITPEEAPILQRFLDAVQDLTGLRGVHARGAVQPLALALAAIPPPPPTATPPPEPLSAVRRRAVVEAMAYEAGNRSRAARRLGVARRTLTGDLRRFGITENEWAAWAEHAGAR